MKMVLICRHLKYGGGMEKFFSLFVNEICSKYKDDVCVILEGSRCEDEYKLDEGVKIIALEEIRETKGITDAITHNVLLYRKLFRHISEYNPDVIISFLPELASLCKIRFPRRCVIGSLRVNPKVDLSGKRNELMSIKATRLLDGFIFLTYEASKLYPRKIRNRCTVIPLGVEQPADVVDAKKLTERRKIYASGRLVSGKHFEVIIKAFSIVYSKHPDYRLCILGDGEERDHLQAEIKRLNIEDAVEMPGIDRSPMTTMLDGSMYVFASESEGYSNALAEAMMIGLPCVATDCDFGPSDMIKNGENGYLVGVNDPDEMAEAMLRLIDNPGESEKFSRNSVYFRNCHDSGRIIGCYYSYLNDVIGGKYRLKLTEKVYNKLSTTEFMVGWSAIENNNDSLLEKKKKKFSLLPLDRDYWYADPIIVEKDGRTVVFMEAYDKEKMKGCLAYSDLSSDGMTKPELIIEEPWHLSFPFVFEQNGTMYMMPETSSTNKLFVYRCDHFPDKWVREYEIDGESRVSDSVVAEHGGKLIVISPEKKQENVMYTKLKLGYLVINSDTATIDHKPFDLLNSGQSFLLDTRNGGSIINEGDKHYRITQVSSPTSYGLSLCVNEIDKLTETEFCEKKVGEIGLENVEFKTPKGYSADGVHTYGKTEKYEVIDVKIRRLSWRAIW